MIISIVIMPYLNSHSDIALKICSVVFECIYAGNTKFKVMYFGQNELSDINNRPNASLCCKINKEKKM